MMHRTSARRHARRAARSAPGAILLACLMIAAASASGVVPRGQAAHPAGPASEAKVVRPVHQRPGWRLHPSNTGLAPWGLSCSDLPAYTGSDHPAAGTRLVRQRFTSPLVLAAGHIVIKKSCFQPTTAWQGLPIVNTTDNDTGRVTSSRVVIEDSEFDGSRLTREQAAWSTAFQGIGSLYRNYVHGFGSGIALMDTGRRLSSVIEGNIVTQLVAWGDSSTTGNHSDGFTVRDFDTSGRPDRTLLVHDNRFNCHSGNCTGAFFIQTYAGRIDNVTLSGNLLEGEGYQLGLNEMGGNAYGNVRAINNRFSGTGWGPAYVQGGPGYQLWRDNYLNVRGVPGHQGRTVRDPS